MQKNVVYDSMIELQFLNYLYKTNSIHPVTVNDIDETYFTTYKEQFSFIVDFYKKYNALPSKETFQGRFSESWEWLSVNDPEEYLVEKLQEAKLYRDVISDYKKLGEMIKDGNTDVAVDEMGRISKEFQKKKKSKKCVDLIDDAKERYDSYLERVNNHNSAFVTTGLKELDDIIGGWDLKNETALICARTGYGKSWWTIFFALQAAKSGLTVGYYSGEMEAELIGYRMDTFLGNIANGSLTHGNENVMDSYETYIDSIKSIVKGHIICMTPDDFNGSVTVSKLEAKIEEYGLQMLCVDQFSLLDDEKRAKTPREQYVNISKDLRSLQRKKKIPIIAAVQLNRMEDDDGPSTKNIAESDRIGQDATTVLFIERKAETAVLSVGKSRNARTGDKLTYAWNINMGILRYIPTDNDARKGKGAEELLDEYGDTDKSDSVF